jgi:hypothetical protein
MCSEHWLASNLRVRNTRSGALVAVWHKVSEICGRASWLFWLSQCSISHTIFLKLKVGEQEIGISHLLCRSCATHAARSPRLYVRGLGIIDH